MYVFSPFVFHNRGGVRRPFSYRGPFQSIFSMIFVRFVWGLLQRVLFQKFRNSGFLRGGGFAPLLATALIISTDVYMSYRTFPKKTRVWPQTDKNQPAIANQKK